MIRGNRFLLIFVSLSVALVLAILPMPAVLLPYRPLWLFLVIAFWTIEEPERVGLGVAFVFGVLMDLVVGTVLGEYALRLVVFTFLLGRFRARFNFYPGWQQTLVLAALLINDRIVAAAVHVATHGLAAPWHYWGSVIVTAVLWVPTFALLDAIRLRKR
ncbi:rod shape-determining protein MreD [Lysobacter sp. HDW10]|uniref:rod shape-determining protein MreD n=1 Tax=Lysobacter sp. HDW10 TaxID=2714936 RepID=UPI00140C388C|nr:rod shape-determining protein MreD [Lysobacter sp. HDW10]QIK81045.1 rod shape-determining protein MreD [Lysobacter sp. HDW10]